MEEVNQHAAALKNAIDQGVTFVDPEAARAEASQKLLLAMAAKLQELSDRLAKLEPEAE